MGFANFSIHDNVLWSFLCYCEGGDWYSRPCWGSCLHSRRPGTFSLLMYHLALTLVSKTHMARAIPHALLLMVRMVYHVQVSHYSARLRTLDSEPFERGIHHRTNRCASCHSQAQLCSTLFCLSVDDLQSNQGYHIWYLSHLRLTRLQYFRRSICLSEHSAAGE